MIEFHDKPYPMRLDWAPNEDLFKQLATHIGLLDASIDPDLLSEFVVYWVGQTFRAHTTYQWHLKLVQNVKFKRTAFQKSETTIVGTQRVPKTAGLVYDDNVRNLLNEYSE